MKPTLRTVFPAYAAPVLVFLILISLTVQIWRQQVHHQRAQIHRHTVDVTMQAARRLEIHVKSRLTIASIFTHHWETHEGESFSKATFHDFASVLKKAVPGYHTIRLVPPSAGSGWKVPASASSSFSSRDPAHLAILRRARNNNRVELSPPLASSPKHRAFFAALPVRRGAVFRGWVVVEFRLNSLVESCFLERIRGEFLFKITDGTMLLYRNPSQGGGQGLDDSTAASREFGLQNRRWRLTMAPHAVVKASSGWLANLWVFIFGLLLSTAIALSIAALAHRMRMYRAAHDQALHELGERQRAEARLRSSETRHRNVFDSATDGLVVFGTDGVIIEANRAACSMHGYPTGALDDQYVTSLISPEFRWRYDDFMQKIEAGGPVQIESTDIRKDGTPLDVEVRGVSFEYGGETRVLAIFSDVTLHKQAQARQAQLARQALMAQEEERARVSRDLHDELGQILTAMRLELDLVRKRPTVKATEFDYTTELLEKATEELRRICRGLRPPLLDDLGAVSAVRQLVEEFEEHSGVVVTMEIDLSNEEWEMPKDVALCIYRIIQESLTNVRRHSNARAVQISLRFHPGVLHLTIVDDGNGFELSEVGHQGAGLAGMKERAELVGGTIDVHSMLGKGTRIEARVPRPKTETEKRS
jgi:PAS domain S-box-containing protein